MKLGSTIGSEIGSHLGLHNFGVNPHHCVKTNQYNYWENKHKEIYGLEAEKSTSVNVVLTLEGFDT